MTSHTAVTGSQKLYSQNGQMQWIAKMAVVEESNYLWNEDAPREGERVITDLTALAALDKTRVMLPGRDLRGGTLLILLLLIICKIVAEVSLEVET